MSKFNTKEKSVVPTTTTNEMGERAYQLAPKEELVSTCLTTFLSNSYYETEKEVVSRVKKALEQVDPLFTAKLTIYLRDEANMRSISHLLAGELAPKISGQEWARRFYSRVLIRPDDMSEILAYYFHKNGVVKGEPNKKIPNAIKKAFRKKLESMDPYLIDKYKMKGRGITLVDLVNLFRPAPSQVNSEAYKRLLKGESLEGLYSSKILEKTLSKAGKVEGGVAAVEKAKEEAIVSVLGNDKGMPIFNLLRNLRNILEIAPESVEEACRQLTKKETILKSRLLPFRFASAYTEIEACTYSESKNKSTSTIVFESEIVPSKVTRERFSELKTLVLSSLEKALEYSIANIPGLVGNTAILIDHSGSVRGDGGGSSKVSAFSRVTTAMIGNLFGSMLAYRQDNVYIGLFGDRLVNIPVDRNKGVLEFNRLSFDKGSQCGGATENGLYIFLSEVIKEKKRVDNLIIFSDMVIGSGGRGGWDNTSRAELGSFQTLFNEFRKINPQCNTVSVDIKQTSGTSVFDKSLKVTQISGWSDKIFDIISANSVGYKALVEEIEKIKI